MLLAVCFVMFGVSLVIGSGTVSANGGTVSTQSIGWCRGCS
jgi:hypothetical protein